MAHTAGILAGVTATKWGDLAARKNDILTAATQIVTADGYRGLSMRKVASEAGVSTGLLYQYFATKDELFAAVVTHRLEDLCRVLGKLPEGQQTLSDVIAAIVPEVVSLWKDVGRFALWWTPQAASLQLSDQASLLNAWSQMMNAIGSVLVRSGAPAVSKQQATPYVVSFVWSTLSGYADDLVNGWSAQNGLDPDVVTQLTISSIVAALNQKPQV